MSTVITITAFIIITVTSAPQSVNLVLTIISVVCVAGLVAHCSAESNLLGKEAST